mmetsp:Transcript_99442/g.214532  ORF Transcript_99442/g.214532 Transcript_99442/m.214532 type:complete len:437 (+) Transcript_99442:266-1576(+)
MPCIKRFYGPPASGGVGPRRRSSRRPAPARLSEASGRRRRAAVVVVLVRFVAGHSEAREAAPAEGVPEPRPLVQVLGGLLLEGVHGALLRCPTGQHIRLEGPGVRDVGVRDGAADVPHLRLLVANRRRLQREGHLASGVPGDRLLAAAHGDTLALEEEGPLLLGQRLVALGLLLRPLHVGSHFLHAGFPSTRALGRRLLHQGRVLLEPLGARLHQLRLLGALGADGLDRGQLLLQGTDLTLARAQILGEVLQRGLQRDGLPDLLVPRLTHVDAVHLAKVGDADVLHVHVGPHLAEVVGREHGDVVGAGLPPDLGDLALQPLSCVLPLEDLDLRDLAQPVERGLHVRDRRREDLGRRPRRGLGRLQGPGEGPGERLLALRSSARGLRAFRLAEARVRPEQLDLPLEPLEAAREAVPEGVVHLLPEHPVQRRGLPRLI